MQDFPAADSHSTPNGRPWQGRLLVAALLLLLTAVYFWRQVAEGQALYWGDIGLYFTPMQVFLKQNLNAGRLPLWNPLLLCGTPYVGNPQTWPLYPMTALLPFVSATQFENLTIALHVWLAGLGTYAFARRALGIGTGPALLAAVTFMFGGQLVSKEQFPNMVQASAWLPWVLFCLHNLLLRKRFQEALSLGLVLGLQLLAAHVQMTLLTLYLATAYGVFVSSARFRWDQTRLLLLSGIVASGLAMGQLLPTLALFRDAARHKLSFSVVDRFYLPFNQLGNFVLPHLHGNPFYGTWTARGNIWETCCYVGVLSFGLAIWGAAAACRRPDDRAVRFWVGVFGVGLWMACGGRGGLYHLAYWVLPGFRSFHDPARCLLWTSFALSLLAAWGLENFPRWVNKNWLMAGIILLAFVDLTHFGRTLYPLTDPAALMPSSPNVTLVQSDPDVQAHQARILAPTGGIWLRFTNYKDFRQSTPGYETLWADTLTPNLLMPYGLSEASGYEPVALKDMETAAAGAARGYEAKATSKEKAEAASLTGALGVKYVSLCRVTPPEQSLPGLAAIRTAPTLAPPGHKRGPASFVYLSRDLDWQSRAHLEGSQAPVILSDTGPDQVVLTVQTSSADRLILEDTQAAGWQATVDGRPVPIDTYHGCLRAVSLPDGGLHRIVFTYAPTPFRLGLYLSLLTLGGLIGATAYSAARKLAARAGIRRSRAESLS